jgi:hypothetical protein
VTTVACCVTTIGRGSGIIGRGSVGIGRDRDYRRTGIVTTVGRGSGIFWIGGVPVLRRISLLGKRWLSGLGAVGRGTAAAVARAWTDLGGKVQDRSRARPRRHGRGSRGAAHGPGAASRDQDAAGRDRSRIQTLPLALSAKRAPPVPSAIPTSSTSSISAARPRVCSSWPWSCWTASR